MTTTKPSPSILRRRGAGSFQLQSYEEAREGPRAMRTCCQAPLLMRHLWLFLTLKAGNLQTSQESPFQSLRRGRARKLPPRATVSLPRPTVRVMHPSNMNRHQCHLLKILCLLLDQPRLSQSLPRRPLDPISASSHTRNQLKPLLLTFRDAPRYSVRHPLPQPRLRLPPLE